MITVNCPFCTEVGFDPIGLKIHLLSGYCEPFEVIDEVTERRKTHEALVAIGEAIKRDEKDVEGERE